MVFKKVITAASALALIAAPTMAVAQSAAAAPEPATESVEGSELRGGFIIPLLALIAIILGLCAATDICGADDDELPKSP
ncbi:MAG TPA: hypothetical protein VF693_05840 [Allosphingosinicella sp.]